MEREVLFTRLSFSFYPSFPKDVPKPLSLSALCNPDLRYQKEQFRHIIIPRKPFHNHNHNHKPWVADLIIYIYIYIYIQIPPIRSSHPISESLQSKKGWRSFFWNGWKRGCVGLVVGEGGGLVEFFKTVELDLASIEFWRNRRAGVFA